FFFQAEDGIRAFHVTGVQTCALPISYAGSFADDATRRELRSYIDEQFVKLVKEYDINNPVDFPGYIDKKLKLRVKQTFIKNQFRSEERRVGKEGTAWRWRTHSKKRAA